MLNTLAPTETMTKDEWKKYRNQGIGGSDVSAVCGLNKYKSQFQLWAEKTGNYDEEPDNEFIYWGKALEPVIRSEFIKRTGFTITTCPVILQHPQYPFMLANIDGIVNTNEGNFIFEAKTASAYLIDEWNIENYVPYQYMLQIQHYMAVTDMQGAYIAALIGGNHFCYHFIKRDAELINMIITLERQFWGYVENNTPPPIDGSEAAKNYINSLFPDVKTTESIVLNDSCLKYVDDFEKYQEQENHYRELKEQSSNELKILIGDNESAVISDKIISWKNISSDRLDTKRLSLELPEIYDKYLNKTAYRRFAVKSRKVE